MLNGNVMYMTPQRIGELNGIWAIFLKITISLFPVLVATGIAGTVYQVRFNARVDAFMNVGDRFTKEMAAAAHEAIRQEIRAEIRLLEKADEHNRIALQNATPEADRRLRAIETSLMAIQSDIVQMRISLAQFRLQDPQKESDRK